MTARRPADWFELSGGALCLDFANTVSERPTDAPIERVETWTDVLEWAELAGLLSAAEARHRAADARAHPQAAASELAAILRDRELIYRLFSDVAAGRTVEPSLDAFNSRLRQVLPSMRLVSVTEDRARRDRGSQGSSRSTGGDDTGRRQGERRRPDIRWTYAGATDDGDAIRGRVLWSAAELLASDRLAALRECEARDCGWLFLDESRGHRRRWCNMRVCGNREKLRRFRAGLYA